MGSLGFTSYSVDNDHRFRSYLKRSQDAVQDLRIPLNLIANDFYKSQKAIWSLKGPGQYPDLAESTKIQKQKKGVSVYPILKLTGQLERAASQRGSIGSVTKIYNKNALVMGVDRGVVPYAIYHQSDRTRKKIPLRKFLFIGPEAKRFATSDQVGRLERWTNILKAYVKKVLEKNGVSVGDL